MRNLLSQEFPQIPRREHRTGASIPGIARDRLIFQSAIGAVIVGGLAWIVFGPSPSEAGVAAAEAAGRNPKSGHFAVTGTRYGAVAVLVLAGTLLACKKWILRPLNRTFEPRSAGIGKGSRGVFALAAAAAVALGYAINAPRLATSLWGDEEQTVKRMVIGNYERNENGLGEELKLRRATWTDTLFRYRTPNNHVLNSVLARVSHGFLFRKSEAPDALHFDSAVIRLPAFIAGLAGIAALGWCVAVLGFPRAGIMGMFLLAIHPWFTRYGVDARGYAFVFLFAPLALAFLVKSLRSGSWRHLLLFALCEFLLFYSYPGTVYILVPLNIAGFLAIALGKGDRNARSVLALRFVTANVIAAMPVIALMTPCLIQLPAYFARHKPVFAIDAGFLADNLSYIAAGIPWVSWDPDNPLCIPLSGFSSLSVALIISAAAGLLVLGIRRLCRSSRQTAILLVALLAPWPLFMIDMLIRNPIIYHWYTVITLPGLMVIMAIGLEALPARSRNLRLRNAAGVALLLAATISYGVFTHPQRSMLRTQSVEPLRESVAATRTVLNVDHPEIDSEMTVGFCMATRGYDPAAYLFKSDDPAAFRALLERARQESKPLHVNLALVGLAKLHFPEMMKIIGDPEIFEPLPTFWGLEQPATRIVYRLR